jgi:hypothetical protein
MYYIIQLHKYELHNFNSSKNIIRVIKSRRIRWVRYVDGREKTYKVLVRKPEGKRPLGGPGVHGRIC